MSYCWTTVRMILGFSTSQSFRASLKMVDTGKCSLYYHYNTVWMSNLSYGVTLMVFSFYASQTFEIGSHFTRIMQVLFQTFKPFVILWTKLPMIILRSIFTTQPRRIIWKILSFITRQNLFLTIFASAQRTFGNFIITDSIINTMIRFKRNLFFFPIGKKKDEQQIIDI